MKNTVGSVWRVKGRSGFGARFKQHLSFIPAKAQGISLFSVKETDMSPKKSKSANPSDYHVMISRGMGKIRAFNISPRTLIWAVLFLFIYIVISIFVINGYFDKRRSVKTQLNLLEKQKIEIDTLRRSLLRAEQRLAVFQEISNNSEDDEADSKAIEPDAQVAPPPEPQMLDEVDIKEKKTDASLLQAAIKGLTIHRDEAKLSFSYKLHMLNNNGQAVRGFTHQILRDHKVIPEQIWTYPSVTFKDGVPVDFSVGQRFVIRRFKTIRGEFFLTPNNGFPFSFEVQVYNKGGKLLLTHMVEVNDDL